GSALARWQAEWVQARLAELGVAAELVIIKTRGDAEVDRPLQQLEGKGFFTKEIEDALLAGRIDVAVHSLKDLPTALPPGWAVAARLDPLEVMPAPGQGALGLEIRSDDQATRTALQPLEHLETAQAVAAERALLAELDSGCQGAVAAYTGMRDGGCVLYGRVTAPDGAIQVTASSAIDPADPAAGGVHVARLLLAQGAASLLAR